MDEETRQAFATMMKLMNDQHERLIDRLTAVEREVKSLAKDFQNTKGFLIDDALVMGRRISNIENRLDDLDKKAG